MMPFNYSKNHDTADYEVRVDPDKLYGYFEHNELGDEDGGGLWFKVMPKSQSGLEVKLELVDYDGVSVLPRQVVAKLRADGYVLDSTFD